MEFKEITKKEVWEKFLEKIEKKTFLQSWEWGIFNQKMGEKIWRIGIYDGPNLIGISLIIKVTAKRGNFLLIPHGPLTFVQNQEIKFQILKNLLIKLKEISKNEKTKFIRIAPIWGKEDQEIFKKLKFRDAPIHVHPEITWQLDISKSEDELLKNMKKRARYLIKKAKKEKIKIFSFQDLNKVESFYKIYLETSRNQKFVPFSKEYLKKEVEAFLPDKVKIFLAQWKGEFLAGGIFIFWKKIGFYHHGGSSKKYPKIPASYLLLWEAILEAKKRNFKIFNFWGIAEVKKENNQFKIKNPNHPWSGLTLFKMGFGGYPEEYLKTQDFPTSFFYWANFILEKMRKKKRGF